MALVKKSFVAIITVLLLVVGIIAGMAYYRMTNPRMTNPLIATINVVERPNNSDLMQMFPELNHTYRPDCLWINGLVSNNGTETAYNAGLEVIAYDAKGTLQINMTVPLSGGAYGTDNATNAFVLDNYRLGTYTEFDSSPWRVDRVGSLEFKSLNGGQTVNVTFAIFHEGTITSWNVTPVWTNNP